MLATSGPIIKEKAQILPKKFPNKNKGFKTSKGWLHRWKTFYSICQWNVNGEKLSADKLKATLYCDELAGSIFDHGYCVDQIFNADETGLNYKMLSSKTLVVIADKEAHGAKKCKECVPVLTCPNACASFRLPLLVIGKSVKPRASKNYHFLSSPVVYKNQKSACIDIQLFLDQFFEEFVALVKKFLRKSGFPEKALPLLNNAPSHPAITSL